MTLNECSIIKKKISQEITIDQINDLLKDDKKVETIFYRRSYPRMIKRFKETRQQNEGHLKLEDWYERVALIYSWMPTIPNRSFEPCVIKNSHNCCDIDLEEAIQRLTSFESDFYQASLLDITIERNNSITNTYIRIPNSNRSESIGNIFSCIGRVMHHNTSYKNQIPSNTKLLHFMCPNLFPILDYKVSHRWIGKEPRISNYLEYMIILQNILNDNNHIIELSKEYKLSPLYLIDLVLFNINRSTT